MAHSGRCFLQYSGRNDNPGQWTTVEATGRIDNDYEAASQLHITIQGAGECLVDNVEVIPSAGTNVVLNSTFETDAAGWVFQGNHDQSGWEPGEGFSSSHSLHIRAVGRGDTGPTRVRTQLTHVLP